MSDTLEKDPYEQLGITPESTLEQIRRAYRVTSLKVHPDKNPSPEAATLFHALTQAYNLLLDPTQRSALDASLAARRARAAQLAASSEKKRTMLEELERAERAAKRFKVDSLAEERKKREEEERVKAQGRRMREEAQRRAEEAHEASMKRQEPPTPVNVDIDELDGKKISPMELTLLLRLPYPPPTAFSLLDSLFSLGPIDTSSFLLRPPKPSKKEKEGKKKGGTAVVQFLTKRGALAASQAGGRRDLGLEGVKMEWAAGEPAWVAKALEETSKPKMDAPSLPNFDFADQGLDYESLTLARMRRAERERLEREIREQEGE